MAMQLAEVGGDAEGVGPPPHLDLGEEGKGGSEQCAGGTNDRILCRKMESAKIKLGLPSTVLFDFVIQIRRQRDNRNCSEQFADTGETSL